jgi:hypothetical protein
MSVTETKDDWNLRLTASSYANNTMNSTLVYIRGSINWIRVRFIEDTIPLQAIAKELLVVSHAVDIKAIIACLFSEAKDIQPGPAECDLLLHNVDPTRVLDLCLLYRYQVIVHLFAMCGLEGCQILPKLCDVADPEEYEVLYGLLHLSGMQRR